jgi:hypothetical protein
MRCSGARGLKEALPSNSVPLLLRPQLSIADCLVSGLVHGLIGFGQGFLADLDPVLCEGLAAGAKLSGPGSLFSICFLAFFCGRSGPFPSRGGRRLSYIVTVLAHW